MTSPVAVFAYNRPEHLRRTLNQLASTRLAAESSVIVFSDGARNAAAAADVAKVRALLREGGWSRNFRRFSVRESPNNLGLAKAIRHGVSSVLREEDSVIVLEDDLLVADDFLPFMNDCLRFYRADSRVGSVTGFCPLTHVPPAYEHDVMAVPRVSSQGWATWTDRWSGVDWNAVRALDVWREPALKARFNSVGSDQLYRLRRQLAGQINSWAIIFNLWQLLSGRVTIYPVHNRIQNIGYDGTGVHTKPGEAKNLELRGGERYRLSVPEVDPSIVAEFKRVYSGGRLGQMKRWTVNLVPPRLA